MQVIINQATPTLIVFISPDNDIIVVPMECAENVHDLELVVTSTSVSSSLLCAHTQRQYKLHAMTGFTHPDGVGVALHFTVASPATPTCQCCLGSCSHCCDLTCVIS